METHSNNKIFEFKDLIDNVFKTESGQALLKLLEEEYCAQSCIKNTPELTYYSLGQKELIEFIRQVYRDDKFKQRLEEVNDV